MTHKAYKLTDAEGKEPLSHAEIDYLAELTNTLPQNPLIVNIGAATGLSTITFLETRPKAIVFSIDVGSCPEELNNVMAAGLDVKRVIRMLGKSQDVGKHFPYKCDLLFVDGDHWNAAGDIETWVKGDKVKLGSIVAFHDFVEPPCPPNNPGEVFAHVNEGMQDYPLIGRVERIIAFRIPNDTKGA